MEKVESLENELKELRDKLAALEKENIGLKEHLKKYTAPSRSKTYYENHKEELLQKMKNNKPSPEKIKETNRKAYLKRKQRLLDNSANIL
jgi:predicted nuclease with TOPRIM domain